MSGNEILDNHLEAVKDNSKTVRNIYLSYLGFAAFIWLTAESVTHLQLLIPDERLALPIIGVKLNVVGFFWMAPILLFLFHIYFALHVWKLADLLAKIQFYMPDREENWGDKIPGSMFLWVFLEPPHESGFVSKLMRTFVFLSFWCVVPTIILRAQWQFLPYHHAKINLLLQILITLSLIISGVFYIKINWLKSRKTFDYNFREKGARFFWKWSAMFFRQLRHWAYLFISFTLSVAFIVLLPLFSWTVLIIPEDIKQNEACFAPIQKPFELIAIYFKADKVKEDKLQIKPKPVAKKERGKLEKLKDIKFKDIKRAVKKSLNEIKVFVKNFLAPESMKNCLQVKDVIARNLNLKEKKLAPQPSDTLIAAYIDQDGNKNGDKLLKEFGTLYLKDRDLRFADLFKADLRKADMRSAQLQGANLAEAQLQSANLFEAKLQAANLRFAQLEGANLEEAQLLGADLSGAQLQDANLQKVKLQGAYLQWTELQGADMRRVQLQGANLLYADLQGANLASADLQGADLRRVKLQGAGLRNSRLHGAVLNGAQLQGANLRNAQLHGADMRRVQLQGADLEEAQLQGADLRNINLQGTSLIESHLEGADLSDAGLDKADFFNVTFGIYEMSNGDIQLLISKIPPEETNDRKNADRRLRQRLGEKTLIKVPQVYKIRFNELKKQKEFKGKKSLLKQESNSERKKIYQGLLCEYPILIKQNLKNEIFSLLTKDDVIEYISKPENCPQHLPEEHRKAKTSSSEKADIILPPELLSILKILSEKNGK